MLRWVRACILRCPTRAFTPRARASTTSSGPTSKTSIEWLRARWPPCCSLLHPAPGKGTERFSAWLLHSKEIMRGDWFVGWRAKAESFEWKSELLVHGCWQNDFEPPVS